MASYYSPALWMGAVTLFAFTSACHPPGPGPSDFSAKLLGDYTLNRTSAHQISISWMGGRGPDVPQIPSKVIECAVHPPFILGKRQSLKPRAPDNPADSYQIPDPDVCDYWILDTRNGGKAIGPLTLEGFGEQRRELGIPEAVVLRDVYTFRQR